MNPLELPLPYGTEDARADALRLHDAPNDTDLLAEVKARLTATDAEFDPNSDELIDPTEALTMKTPRDIAAALLYAAVALELRRKGTTERAEKARVTRRRNREAKEAAKQAAYRAQFRTFDVDKVHKHD